MKQHRLQTKNAAATSADACRPVRPMTAATFRQERLKLGLSQAALAARLRVTTTTLARWEREERGIPGLAEVALAYVKSQGTKEGRVARR
jgi:DNA-binding transcriptional regulator YiaG